MDSIEEKRVYDDRRGALEAYVGCSVGVVRVRVAGDSVGEFGLYERCTVRDLATFDGGVAIATDEDVRVGTPGSEAEGDDGPTFSGTGFGPAVAVGSNDGNLLAADGDGAVFRRRAGCDEWTILAAETAGAVRAIDGDLVGTDAGVYRAHDGGLDHAGLTDVRDVSAAGVPLAATDDGLYKLGNGWMVALEGPFETVGADPRTTSGRLERAHAATDEALYEHDGDDWREADRTDAPIAGVGYGETTYVVTEDGDFRCASDDGEWRSHALGVDGVVGLAVAPARV
ncbi:HVO_0234 family beta-propeller protein [Natrarchaeobius oligotrophus]|uniref:HVO-0234-like beta-propeller domain-containing protein n=1 Tax=Natrarchaeobius chitinivorans TaxID=1679083 RepID=A0A3N6PAE3_NATCH|nr:hypothetical protein [Natrarchaeobius chitinivorans]RQG96079.1 hypothetical protein EA472_20945 [Natrarchaeobius chitinivorans]